MSTVKANNVQVGQSGTATNNFTLYQPSTPDGTVRLAVGNSGATTGDVLSVSSTGLSVTGTLTSTGVNTFPAGSASAPSITTTGDTNTGVFFPAADTAAITTGGTERMRITSAGNVGIGASSPGTKLDVRGTPNADYGVVNVFDTTTAALGVGGVLAFGGYKTSTTGGAIFSKIKGIKENATSNNEAGALVFETNSGSGYTERMRITSGGEVYIAGTTDQGAYNLQVNGTGVWGAGAYVNGSDERLKDNIQTLNDGLAVVSQLRPVTFQYKPEHSKDQSVQPGFIAQELQQAMDGKAYLDGVVQSGPEYLNVAYQNLIPILTKAIQEQQALITSLTARVAALEGTQP